MGMQGQDHPGAQVLAARHDYNNNNIHNHNNSKIIIIIIIVGMGTLLGVDHVLAPPVPGETSSCMHCTSWWQLQTIFTITHRCRLSEIFLVSAGLVHACSCLIHFVAWPSETVPFSHTAHMPNNRCISFLESNDVHLRAHTRTLHVGSTFRSNSGDAGRLKRESQQPTLALNLHLQAEPEGELQLQTAGQSLSGVCWIF